VVLVHPEDCRSDKPPEQLRVVVVRRRFSYAFATYMDRRSRSSPALLEQLREELPVLVARMTPQERQWLTSPDQPDAELDRWWRPHDRRWMRSGDYRDLVAKLCRQGGYRDDEGRWWRYRDDVKPELSFPKGGLNHHWEHPCDAAVRELWEETKLPKEGVELLQPYPVKDEYDDGGRRWETVLYLGRLGAAYEQCVPQAPPESDRGASWEVAEAGWMTLGDYVWEGKDWRTGGLDRLEKNLKRLLNRRDVRDWLARWGPT
jgi:ADP-ribose pyrophosphatase YjhB (NUDIX family)